ncbi:MAG: chemotaxis protein CheC [Rhodoferax sp.]|nr:chemotaxis protein CheX [Rhodoferax sp.]MDP3651489.1 chemotaxis protein CheC [Rhodoferax sp.]
MMALKELEQDALTEIFNIGVGMAADVLSQMVGERVKLSVPVVELTNQQQAKNYYLEREQRQLCAIRQTFSGEVTTDAILMFPEENSLELVRLMVGGDLPLEQLTEMEQDAMAEIGNIILNAVISSISSTLGLTFEGSLPDVSVVTTENIFSHRGGAIQVSDEKAPVLALTIDFELSTRQVSGYLAFLLDIPSSEKLISRLDRFMNGSAV